MERRIVNNTYRAITLTIIVLSLIYLGLHSHTVGTSRDRISREILSGCISKTNDCPQQSVVLTAQIKSISQSYFVVNVRTKKGARWEDLFDREYDLKVLSKEFQIAVGNIIGLKGYFISPQIIQLEEYEIEDPWIRELKYGISIIALLLTLMLWMQNLRFSLTKFSFFWKENP